MKTVKERLEEKFRQKLRNTANHVARKLFTDGRGKSADRLRFDYGQGPTSCGWAENAAADRIYEALRERLLPKKHGLNAVRKSA